MGRKPIHNIKELKEFCENNHRLPSYKEVALYKWMNKEIRKNNKEVIEFVKGKRKNMHHYSLSDLITFYENNHRLPGGKKEMSFYNWMNREINRGNKEVIEFVEGKENRHYYSFSELISFYENNHRLPSCENKEEDGLYYWMKKEIKKENKEVIEYVKGKESRHYYSFSKLISFYENNHRLPSQCNKKEMSFYNWMKRGIKNGNKELKAFTYLVKNQDNSNNQKLLDLYIKQHKG